jgi:hypothetical protein
MQVVLTKGSGPLTSQASGSYSRRYRPYAKT